MKLFHGTTDKKLKEIRKKGLSSRKYVAGSDGVWLTDQPQMAEWFGGIKVDEDGGKLLICEVETKEKNLSADLISYDMPSYEVLADHECDLGDVEESEKCWQDKIDKGEIPFPKSNRDWKTSLKTVHSVISIKPIPPSNIKCQIME